MRNPFSRLMLTTALRAPDGVEAAPAVAAPVVEAAPAAPAIESPAGAAPAAGESSQAPASAGPAAGEPKTEAAPVVEAPKSEAETDPAKPEAKPSLLTELQKAEAKPEAAAVVDPAAAAAAALPTYEAFTMPEGVEAKGEVFDQFTKLLGENKLTQEQGQAFVELFGKATQAYADHVRNEQQRIWTETNEKWVSEIKADKEFGGAKFDTSTKAAMRMIELLVPKEERAEFNAFMDHTGAGNNPWMFKMLNRVAQWLDEPVIPRVATKPAKGAGKAPGQPRGLRSMYKGAPN